MRLYMIQSLQMWHLWQRIGVLHANPAYVDQDFLPAYYWMAKQMRRRIGHPPLGCLLPVWAWYQWDGVARTKPDLRTSGFLPMGQKGVRLCLDVDEKKVLLSDFDLWHYVLNYWYLGETLSDQIVFEAHNDTIMRDSQIQASWQRIFDIDWHSPDIADPRPAKSLQATLWEVRLEQVISHEFFIAR